jgi:predicted aldo/keto reductase-like oxidoreductase
VEKAASCTQCGECEERCPYHLPIRDMLAEYVNLYQREKSKYQG